MTATVASPKLSPAGQAVLDAMRHPGAGVLNEVAAWLARYLALPTPHALTVLVLWAAHTHASEKFYVTPRLILDSAEPASGKTRVLELLALLCHRPKLSISTTTAALYRRIAEGPLTLLLDETDAIFAPKSAPQHEDLRALLNAGYKRGATVDRCVGDGSKIKVVEFPVFAPVALAGLAGRMPATVTTRGVTLHMRRRAPSEHVDPFTEQEAEQEAKPLHVLLAEWATEVADELRAARPTMPAGVVDRPAENWRALLAVADAAGGAWPGLARAACSYFVLDTDPGELSLGIRLLADLRVLYTQRDTDRMPSAEIVTALREWEESPWGDLWGKPLDTRRLARELGRYGIASKNLKLADGRVVKGYRTDGADGLRDGWLRYLPEKSATTATGATSQASTGSGQDTVAATNATSTTSATSENPLTSEVAEVAPVAPNTGADIRTFG
ncbi:MAG: DUF3631 domain-containing protein [Pseudonocardiaceae bacterium]